MKVNTIEGIKKIYMQRAKIKFNFTFQVKSIVGYTQMKTNWKICEYINSNERFLNYYCIFVFCNWILIVIKIWPTPFVRNPILPDNNKNKTISLPIKHSEYKTKKHISAKNNYKISK